MSRCHMCSYDGPGPHTAEECLERVAAWAVEAGKKALEAHAEIRDLRSEVSRLNRELEEARRAENDAVEYAYASRVHHARIAAAERRAEEYRVRAEGLAEALESAKTAIACHSRDWSLHRRDAWLWGLICGWEDSMDEIARMHRWTLDDVERLRRLHAALALALAATPETPEEPTAEALRQEGQELRREIRGRVAKMRGGEER